MTVYVNEVKFYSSGMNKTFYFVIKDITKEIFFFSTDQLKKSLKCLLAVFCCTEAIIRCFRMCSQMVYVMGA